MIRRIRLAIDEFKWAREKPYRVGVWRAIQFAWHIFREGI